MNKGISDFRFQVSGLCLLQKKISHFWEVFFNLKTRKFLKSRRFVFPGFKLSIFKFSNFGMFKLNKFPILLKRIPILLKRIQCCLSEKQSCLSGNMFLLKREPILTVRRCFRWSGIQSCWSGIESCFSRIGNLKSPFKCKLMNISVLWFLSGLVKINIEGKEKNQD